MEASAFSSRQMLWAAAALVGLGFASLPIDMPVARAMAADRLPGDVRRSLMIMEAFAQGFGIAMIVLTVWVLDPIRRAGCLRLAAAAYLPGVPVHLLKQLVARTRPSASQLSESLGQTFTGWVPAWSSGDFGATHLQSFPSGHSATAFGLALGLGSLYPRGRWLFLGFAGLAAAQRVVALAHYPSDICFGAAIGCLVASVLYRRGQARPPEASGGRSGKVLHAVSASRSLEPELRRARPATAPLEASEP